MTRVMEKLNIPIPPFILQRRLIVKLNAMPGEQRQLTILGVDVDRTPVTFLKSVRLEHNRRLARSEPFVFDFRTNLDPGTLLTFELEFMGHYGEPNLQITHEYSGEGDAETLYLLEYSPHSGEWQTRKEDNRDVGEGM